MSNAKTADRREEGLFGEYAEKPIPLGGYSVLLGTWSAVFGGLLIAGAVKGKLPEHIRASDILLLGIATHKLTRVLTKDWVTAPLRAPFVRYVKSLGSGEVREAARGTGLRHAIGDLVTCPWCTGPWAAGALVFGLVARPRATRVFAATFAAVAVSDFLHRAYAAVGRHAG